MEILIGVLVSLAVIWLGAIGIGLTKAILKFERSIVRYDGLHERHEERLDGHDERLNKHSNHIFGKGCKIAVLFALLMILPGCSLLGLDMEQAQADAEETASAIEIVKKRLPAIQATRDQLLDLHDAALRDGDLEEAARIWPELQRSIKELELTKEEKKELETVFDKRVAELRAAKDTKGYLQAALGIFGGVFTTLFGGGKIVHSMLKRRNKIIQVTASNITETGGNSEALKALQRERLDKAQRELLSKLRKA